MESVQSSSYGSESRGSACHAGVIISDEPISYPNVRDVSILIAMSQVAYEKFALMVKPGGRIFYDDNSVELVSVNGVEQAAVPATDLATKLGNANVANVCMLSAVIAATGIIERKSLQAALKDQCPERFMDINMQAIGAGFGLRN